MSFKPSNVTSESGHWYDRSGVQVATVIGSKGQQVKPDLRHARKFGFAPGVTTILKAAHKESLVQYREKQVLLASLTLPQIARVLTSGPARIFDLGPAKGAIAVGSDADLLWPSDRWPPMRIVL